MQFRVSNRTAALAGIWAGLGVTLIFGVVMPHQRPSTVYANNVIDLVLLTVFVFAPGWLFVAGGPTTLAELKFWQFYYSDQRGIFTKEVIRRWLSFWLTVIVTQMLLGGLLSLMYGMTS